MTEADMERLGILFSSTLQMTEIMFVIIHSNYSKLNLATSYDKYDWVAMGNKVIFLWKIR